MGREIVKDYSQHACANQSSRLEEVHSCRTCAVWVHTDRSLKGLIGETAAHVSCLRAGDVSHCVYVESHHGCCWNGTRRGRKEDRSGEGRSPASRYCGKRASSLSRYLRCQAHVERGDREDNKNCPYKTACHKHLLFVFSFAWVPDKVLACSMFVIGIVYAINISRTQYGRLCIFGAF